MRPRDGFGLVALCGALIGCASATDAPAAESTPSATATAEPVDVPYIEADLEAQVDMKLGVRRTQVTCPTYVSGEVGSSFQCDVVAPGFPPGLAQVTWGSDDGRYSWFLTNTCAGEQDVASTPLPGCVTPDPSQLTNCPWVKGRVGCSTLKGSRRGTSETRGRGTP